MASDEARPHEDGAPDERARTARRRATEARERAREIAGRLARTGDDIAVTLDRLASTRERAAGLEETDSDDELRSARRARARAEGERQDSAELRATWDVPPTE
ncbi:hypothetical protein EV188_115103 [Actinomycetospora succinea]|uniref:Uncharacterized protein n=1 Tax=Actinomycetospora succinea TaxID=663603 RepID=A0A4R6UMF0_9PSEU|nr:hypothetical protein [Actinomycetospora succinea]TDQ46729.1 hypothetical protein EV188_115103 [Actinomycetospora succinea]